MKKEKGLQYPNRVAQHVLKYSYCLAADTGPKSLVQFMF